MTVLLALIIEQKEKLRQAALQRGLDSERLLHESVPRCRAAARRRTLMRKCW